MSLSPGVWHEDIPRDLKKNRVYRERMLLACLKSASRRRAVVHACKRDLFFWINSFVWQYNPQDPEGGIGPFITWPFQEEAARRILSCIERRKDCVIEKSREMGASWLCLIIADWLCWSRPHQQCLFISRSADAVDGGGKNSLFSKIDFIHRHMPAWLRGGFEHTKMLISYAGSGSEISGEASTGRAGVGGRATMMFIDEFSQIREDNEVYNRTADTSGCRVFNGTHVGLGTVFYRLTDPRENIGAATEKVQMHWSQHPRKKQGLYRSCLKDGRPHVIDTSYQFPADYPFVLDGSPEGGPFAGLRSVWYDMRIRRSTNSRQAAMDLDINPAGTVSQFFSPGRIRDLVERHACEPYWEGELVHDADTGEFVRLVQREGGPLRLWLHPDRNGRVRAGEYAVGADVSMGGGATPSCLAACDCKTGEKVLEYATPWLLPAPMGSLAVAVCRMLSSPLGEPAKLVWEKQGPGVTFGRRVIELGHRRVYHRADETNPLGTGKVSDNPGWNASNDNKRVLLLDYQEALYQGRFTNRSRAALEECLKFHWSADGKKVEHSGEKAQDDPTGATVNHGDMVIADALCCMMSGCAVARPAGSEFEADEPPFGSILWLRRRREREAVRGEEVLV